MKQIFNVIRISDIPREKAFKILRESAAYISEKLDVNKSPGHNATMLYRLFKSLSGIDDPYRSLKDKYNKIALSMEPMLKEKLYDKSDSKLEIAVRLAATGNVIDFGVPRKFNLEKEVENVLKVPFAHFDRSIFERFLVPGKTVLYLADNAGEIVFDKFLLKELKEKGLKVVFAVRGKPILNDATVEDAANVGINSIVDRIVTTGSDFIGVDFEFITDEFRKAWEDAFFVISKGQGNLETLAGPNTKDIFFILKAKCSPVAHELSCNVGELVFAYNKRLLELKNGEA